MHPVRKRKLTYIIFAMVGIAIATSLVLYALRQNINLFYTPSQVLSGAAPSHSSFRVGGLVEKGSLHHQNQDLQVSFLVSDGHKAIRIVYKGILPDLFREGQGIVAQGRLNQQGEFVADQVLAKHDENYMPPELRDVIPQQKNKLKS